MPGYREYFADGQRDMREGNLHVADNDVDAMEWFRSRSRSIPYDSERLVWQDPPADGALLECYAQVVDTGLVTFRVYLTMDGTFGNGRWPGQHAPFPLPPPPPPPDPKLQLDAVYACDRWKDD